MFQKVKDELKVCSDIVDDLNSALQHTMVSSKDYNTQINDARARMKVCLQEMRDSELPPRKERAIR